MNVDAANIYNIQKLAKEFTASMTSKQRGKIVQAGGISVGKPNVDFINAAMDAQGVNSAAVEKAQELIATGTLETPENIQQAANNILEYGI